MVEQALPAHPPKDHLTRKLLRRYAPVSGTPLESLLETLCTDSIYSLTDDFDEGLDPYKWVTKNLIWNDYDINGSLSSEVAERDPDIADEPDDESGVLLRSRLAGWVLPRRPFFQARIQFSAGNIPFEFGFTSEDPNTSLIVNTDSSSTWRSNVRGSFGLLFRDPNFNSNSWAVIVGSPATSSSGGTSRLAVTPAPTVSGFMSLAVGMNEQGEVRAWVNGQHDNVFVRDTAIVAAPHYLWLYAKRGAFQIDYVHARQERNDIA